MARKTGSRDKRPRRKVRVIPSYETLAERARARREARGDRPSRQSGAPDPHPPTPREEVRRSGLTEEELAEEARRAREGEDDQDDDTEGDGEQETTGSRKKKKERPRYHYDPDRLYANLSRGCRGMLDFFDPDHPKENREDGACVADAATPVIEKHTGDSIDNWEYAPEAVLVFTVVGIIFSRLRMTPSTQKPPGGASNDETIKTAGSGRAEGAPGS